MSTRTHRVRVRGAVPGVLVRMLVLALIVVGAVTLVPFPVWQVVAVAAGGVAAVFPRSLAAWAAAACLPFSLLLSAPSAGATAVTMLLVHAIHVVASWSLVVPVWSRTSLRAWGPSLGRFAVVQLIAQPVAYGAALLAEGSGISDLSWMAPLAAGALLLGILLALRAVRRADREAEAGPSSRPTALVEAIAEG